MAQSNTPVSTKNPISKKKGFQPRPKKPINPHCSICSESIDSEQMYTYIGKSCSCRSSVHDRCFQKWNILNPGACPSCRKQTTILLEPIRQPTVKHMDNEDINCLACICGCWAFLGIAQIFSN
jgi:hypothetical protein